MDWLLCCGSEAPFWQSTPWWECRIPNCDFNACLGNRRVVDFASRLKGQCGTRLQRIEYLQCHHLAPCSAKCVNRNCSGYGEQEASFCEMTATVEQQRAAIEPGFEFRCSICRGRQSAMGLYYKHYQDYGRAMHITYMLMHDYPIFIVRHELGLRRAENINKELEFLGDVATQALTDHFNSQRRTWQRLQADEVCFGKKKDGRGNHGRTDSDGKSALEWYMSMTENDENGRTTDFFLEPCPGNR